MFNNILLLFGLIEGLPTPVDTDFSHPSLPAVDFDDSGIYSLIYGVISLFVAVLFPKILEFINRSREIKHKLLQERIENIQRLNTDSKAQINRYKKQITKVLKDKEKIMEDLNELNYHHAQLENLVLLNLDHIKHSIQTLERINEELNNKEIQYVIEDIYYTINIIDGIIIEVVDNPLDKN